MESEIEQTHISSELFDKKKFQQQLDIIKQASEIAQAKIDYFSAHDDNVIRAVDVVEDFLRKKHRLCYGGQAINAHLPAKYKFYDPEYSIPDYDFFTPQQPSDIITLIKDLKKAGFTEISAREGMHEGTVKIYVDYVPVADITAIDPKLYRILSKREFKTDGISYLDANTLRMLMYLELSRPRGEVTRWPKVFERLSLFNEFVPVKPCHIAYEPFHGGLNNDQLQFAINYIIKNKRIFAGADLLDFYNTSLKTKRLNTKWVFTTKKPIIFFSSESDNDAKQLRSEFNFLLTHTNNSQNEHTKSKPITIKSYSSRGVELLPSMKVISQGNKSLVFIIDQVACHSYFNIPISRDSVMRIASLDTLITLYFSLGLVDSSYFDMGSMECLANKLVDISLKARKNPKSFPLPFISIKCTGHQTSLPSLIRQKVKRITQKKQETKQLLLKANSNNKRNRRNTIKVNKKDKFFDVL
jgi:Poly(A) polymerase catalytic subunit